MKISEFSRQFQECSKDFEGLKLSESFPGSDQKDSILKLQAKVNSLVYVFERRDIEYQLGEFKGIQEIVLQLRPMAEQLNEYAKEHFLEPTVEKPPPQISLHFNQRLDELVPIETNRVTNPPTTISQTTPLAPPKSVLSEQDALYVKEAKTILQNKEKSLEKTILIKKVVAGTLFGIGVIALVGTVSVFGGMVAGTVGFLTGWWSASFAVALPELMIISAAVSFISFASGAIASFILDIELDERNLRIMQGNPLEVDTDPDRWGVSDLGNEYKCKALGARLANLDDPDFIALAKERGYDKGSEDLLNTPLHVLFYLKQKIKSKGADSLFETERERVERKIKEIEQLDWRSY